MTPLIPPQATDVEQAVIGACLLDDPEAVLQALAILQPTDFYLEKHAFIWEAIGRLVAASKPVDLLTLTEELNVAGRLSIAGGEAYLMEVSCSASSSANIEAHAAIVKDKALIRAAIHHASAVLQAGYQAGARASDVLPILEDAAFRLSSQDTTQRGLEPLRPILSRTAQQMEAAATGELVGVRTGFMDLDRVLCGMAAGDLVILAARPGMGKTALALDIALQCQVPVAFFSLEMSSEQLAGRLLSKRALVDSLALRNGNAIKVAGNSIREAFTFLAEKQIHIDDFPTKTPMQILSQCKRMKMKSGLGLVIVDYIQILSLGRRAESKRHEIEEISKTMKQVAKELGVPVMALAQLSRACEQREDKRPMKSDLRESGQLEQDADTILFIYRDEVYNEDGEPGKAEILISKNRGGPEGFVALTWQGQYTKFSNYTSPLVSGDGWQGVKGSHND